MQCLALSPLVPLVLPGPLVAPVPPVLPNNPGSLASAAFPGATGESCFLGNQIETTVGMQCWALFPLIPPVAPVPLVPMVLPGPLVAPGQPVAPVPPVLPNNPGRSRRCLSADNGFKIRAS